MVHDIQNMLISIDSSIKDALRQMQACTRKILIVTDAERRLKGVVTDGNLRRFILERLSLDGTVAECFNPSPVHLREGASNELIRRTLLEHSIDALPLVDLEGRVTRVVNWAQLYSPHTAQVAGPRRAGCPAVVMAGGKGTRLDPFTRILPKPLVPIGNTPVIGIIVDRLIRNGIDRITISVHHKAKIIRAYFEEEPPACELGFIEESTPLGTAGALHMLDGVLAEPFLVTNCDILIDCGYADLMDFHREHGFDITLVGALRNYTIPYGVCETENERLLRIREKPGYDFLANTGMYAVSPGVLGLVPRDRPFHFTDLIDKVMREGGKVGVFPVDDGAWIDVGQWEEYRKAVALMDPGTRWL